jgi:hypothetical protein
MAGTVQLTSEKGLKAFIPYKEGVSAKVAIQRVAETGMIIASNAKMEKAFAGDGYKSIVEVFPCWTGTMAAYVEPRTEFNRSKMFSKELKAIVYTDPETRERWIFPIGDYGSEKNAILVSEHPDYSLEIDGKEIMIRSNVIDIIPNFPEKDGWYPLDGKHGIPTGKEIGSRNPQASRLWRVDGSGRVGPVARGYNFLDYYFRRNVNLNNGSSALLGVASLGGTPKGARALEAKPAQMTVTREDDGTLVVRGTKEQLDAAEKLLRQ